MFAFMGKFQYFPSLSSDWVKPTNNASPETLVSWTELPNQNENQPRRPKQRQPPFWSRRIFRRFGTWLKTKTNENPRILTDNDIDMKLLNLMIPLSSDLVVLCGMSKWYLAHQHKIRFMELSPKTSLNLNLDGALPCTVSHLFCPLTPPSEEKEKLSRVTKPSVP